MTDSYSLTFVEIDLIYGACTYGVAPCTAAIGVTGDAKCFNTTGTCQDRANFQPSTVTLRFGISSDYLRESGIVAIPILDAVKFSPGRISLGRDLGLRASVSATFGDQPWSDTPPGFDKYHLERGIDLWRQGTFWGKFQARHPSLRGRTMRVIRGFLGQTLAEMETRTYIIEDSGPLTPGGTFSITAKDVLKLLDADRAQAPAVSKGRLSASISSSTTSAALVPAGIGEDDYEASGWLNFGGKEIVSYTRTADALVIDRAELGTPADAHASGDRVQQVLRYSGEDPADIVYDLCIRGGIDPTFIDLAAWQAETAAYNRRLYTGTIAEPTPIRDLIGELCEQAALAIWWDDVQGKIRLQVLRPITPDVERFDDNNILPGTLQIDPQPDKRKTQIWTYFGQANPLESQTDLNNYRAAPVVTIEAQEEEDFGAPAYHKILSRWIPDGGRNVAIRLNDLLLARYKRAPRRFRFSVFRDGLSSPTMGEGCLISGWPLQGPDGAPVNVPIQITSIDPDATEIRVEAEEFIGTADADDPNDHTITIDGDLNDANILVLHDQIYPTLVGGETVTFVLEGGTVIGSTSTAVPSLDSGDPEEWPSVAITATRTIGNPTLTSVGDVSAFKVGMGVTGNGVPNRAKILSINVGAGSITLDTNAASSGTGSLTVWTVILKIVNRGRVQGPGGNGGRGKTKGGAAASSGEAGGVALRVRVPVHLTDAEGEESGGGGGAGGGGVLNLDNHKGGGGGAGAGRVPGYGGGSDYQAGASGSLDAGGNGGLSYASNWWFEPPFPTPGGGRGGDPGQPGETGGIMGGNFAESAPGFGGPPGAAIDGVSFVTTVGSVGVRRGPTIN